MEIRIAEVDSELEIVGSLLIQLRPSYDLRPGQSHYKLIFTMRLCYFWPFYGD